MIAAGAAVSLAQLLRYEGWVFAPAIVVWWLVRTRSARSTIALALLVLWFPIAWTIGNARCGDALMGLRAAVQEPAAGAGYGGVESVAYVTHVGVGELGLFLVLAMLCGVVVETTALVRRRISRDRLLALALVGTAWIVLGRFAMSRGPSAWNRYFLTALVLALPFAAAPLRLVRGGRRARVATTVVVAVLLLALVMPDLAGLRARHWLRVSPPSEAASFASWLAADPVRAARPILATPVGWELTFLPLFAPQVYPRFKTGSGWIAEDEVRVWIRELRGRGPFFVATRDGDETDLARFEHAAGVPLAVGVPVFRTGALRVYVAELGENGAR